MLAVRIRFRLFVVAVVLIIFLFHTVVLHVSCFLYFYRLFLCTLGVVRPPVSTR